MIKPILFSTSLLFFAACGSNTNPPETPTQPTAVIPEQVDGVVATPDTLPAEVLPEAEKVIEKEVEKPTSKPNTSKAEKPTAKPGKTSIHGSWTLEKVYGAKEPFNMLFPNQAPDVTFDLKTNTLSGKNGCNSYNGPFSLKNGVLTISEMITTRMFCEGVKESLFMTTLKMANNYRVDENGKLILKLDEENLMLFKAK